MPILLLVQMHRYVHHSVKYICHSQNIHTTLGEKSIKSEYACAKKRLEFVCMLFSLLRSQDNLLLLEPIWTVMGTRVLIMILSYLTDRLRQTMSTQIRLLLLVILSASFTGIFYNKTPLFKFKDSHRSLFRCPIFFGFLWYEDWALHKTWLS